MSKKRVKHLISFLMMISIFACDPLVRIDNIIENQSSDAILVILETNQMNSNILEIPAGGDYRISFNDDIDNSVSRFYRRYDDSLAFNIIDIQKDSVSCKKNWELKNNWQYDEFDERTAELRFVVVDSDF